MAPPGCFQIDVMVLNDYKSANAGVTRALLVVEIGSRKAWVYPLKDNTVAGVLTQYRKFLADVGAKSVIYVEGDAFFGAKEFVAFNAAEGIEVYHDVAEDDHITKGSDRLGIVDRFTRTLKKRIKDHVRSTGNAAWTRFLDALVDDYNATGHSSLDERTPDEVFADYDARMDAYLAESEVNAQRRAGHPQFEAGDVVRIVVRRGTFDKEDYRLSKELYVVVGPDGNRWRVKDKASGEPLGRRVKGSEMVKADADGKTAFPGAAAVQKVTQHARAERRAGREGIAVDADAVGGGARRMTTRSKARKGKARKGKARARAPASGTQQRLDTFDDD